MTEQKVKKRAWVKNAAIIFLSVMLVLTFFSNTIMNHSLAEVAASYVQSGAINAKIRGSGTVAAMESYEVKSEQSREVLSVPVQVGDEVKVGDTLVLYSDAESSQLREAEDALDALVLAYQKALLNANDSDYSKENRDIALAQKALEKAKATRDANTYSEADYAAAQANVNRADAEITQQKAIIANLESQLSGLSGGAENSAEISAKRSEISAAQKKLASAMLAYKTDYDNFINCATAWRETYPASEQQELQVYKDALYEKYTALLELTTFPTVKPSNDIIPALAAGLTYDEDTITAMAAAYNAVHTIELNISSLQSALSALYAAASADSNYYTLKSKLATEQDTLLNLQTIYNSYSTSLKKLEEKKTKFDAAQTTVEENQKTLEDLMFDLAEKQKTDGKTAASAALDLAAQRKQIDEKKEDLEKLKAGGEGASVESKVNGIVASVNVSAGKTAEADAVMMTIEVPDMGYGVSFSVTNEQSKKVKVGDAAEITNYYYGGDISATLIAIKTDPQNPGTNKILSFKLQGEVESGTQLAVSIGERGGSYDALVPNSAIRSDNNGKFVLTVVAKSSPLGNRYIATRIDVKVMASDDVNTAVSGALTTSDMVITTSTKPIEPGSQVRLAD
ncbi:MAG: HlyD family efflux transporter periplasmic adaptor subunit [Clostridia bacterium]|nr:HlyD family efflux transporter periplasmic adaptor subunit [Clostridia bacterium]